MADTETAIHPRVQSVLEKDQGILEGFGMTVVSARDGECEIHCIVPQTLINAAGFAHGSIAFSLLDTASAYALGTMELRGVTLNANVSYVRGAVAGSAMRASVKIVSRTRRIVTLRGEVFLESDEGAELAAHGTLVFQLIQIRT